MIRTIRIPRLGQPTTVDGYQTNAGLQQNPAALVPARDGQQIIYQGTLYTGQGGIWTAPGAASITPNPAAFGAGGMNFTPYGVPGALAYPFGGGPAAAPAMQSTATVPAAPATTTPAATILQASSVATVPASTTAAPPLASPLLTTADIETVANLMLTYGDTWDNAQTIVNLLYAAGAAPGTVTDAMALPYLTNLSTTATAASTSTVDLTSPSTWPWYYWAAGAGALVLVFSGGRKSR